MFNELDAVTLTAAIPVAEIEDIDADSPLHNSAPPGPGLHPGDCGTIVGIQGNGAAYIVEFLDRITGYTIAMTTVQPEQIRLSTTEDHADYRFANPETQKVTLDDGTVAIYIPETDSYHIVNDQGQQLHNPNPFEPYNSHNWRPVDD